MKKKLNFYSYGVLFLLTVLFISIYNKWDAKWYDFILLYFIGKSLGKLVYSILHKEEEQIGLLPYQIVSIIFKKAVSNNSFLPKFFKNQVITFFYFLIGCIGSSLIFSAISQFSIITGVLYVILTSLIFIDISRMLLRNGYFFHQFFYKIIFFIILPFIFFAEKYCVNSIYWYNYFGTSIYFSLFCFVNLFKRMPNNIEIVAINIMNHFNSAKVITQGDNEKVNVNIIFELAAVISQLYYVRNNLELINDFRKLSNNYTNESNISVENLTEFIIDIEYLIFKEDGYSFYAIKDAINKNTNRIVKIIKKDINNIPPPMIYQAVLYFMMKNPDYLEGEYIDFY